MLKIIFKTALKTLLIILIAAVLTFGIISFASPGTMAYAFESCGAYSVAAGYSSIQYKYTGKIDDLSRCFGNCVAANDDKGVDRFGSELLNDPRFADYCDGVNGELSQNLPQGYEKSVDFMQYVYGKVACAKYAGGDKDGAVALVKEGLRHVVGFPENNALVETAIKASENGDGETKAALLEILSGITPSESEKNYYDRVKNILL